MSSDISTDMPIGALRKHALGVPHIVFLLSRGLGRTHPDFHSPPFAGLAQTAFMLVAIALAGAGLALWGRARKPKVYAHLGRTFHQELR